MGRNYFRRNFFKINFAIHDSKIKEIYLCDLIGSKKPCGFFFLFFFAIDSYLYFISTTD